MEQEYVKKHFLQIMRASGVLFYNQLTNEPYENSIDVKINPETKAIDLTLNLLAVPFVKRGNDYKIYKDGDSGKRVAALLLRILESRLVSGNDLDLVRNEEGDNAHSIGGEYDEAGVELFRTNLILKNINPQKLLEASKIAAQKNSKKLYDSLEIIASFLGMEKPRYEGLSIVIPSTEITGRGQFNDRIGRDAANLIVRAGNAFSNKNLPKGTPRLFDLFINEEEAKFGVVAYIDALATNNLHNVSNFTDAVLEAFVRELSDKDYHFSYYNPDKVAAKDSGARTIIIEPVHLRRTDDQMRIDRLLFAKISEELKSLGIKCTAEYKEKKKHDRRGGDYETRMDTNEEHTVFSEPHSSITIVIEPKQFGDFVSVVEKSLRKVRDIS